MPRVAPLPTLVGLLLLACVVPCAAQPNLIVNGTFNTTTTGWTGATFWDGTRDASNNPNSGSDQVEVVTTSNACAMSIQCVPLTPGTTYEMSAEILFPSGSENTAAGEGGVGIAIYPGSNCTGTQNGATLVGILSTTTTPKDTWQTVSSVLVAPATAQSANVELSSCANVVGKTTTNFDNVVVQVAPIAAVPALGSSGLVALTALLALAALGALRLVRSPTP